MPDGSGQPRIGFNALLYSPSGDYRAAGIHRYIDGLLRGLSAEPLDLVAFTASAEAAGALPVGVVGRPAPGLARRRAGRIAWEQLGLPRDLRRAGCVLFHSAAYALPLLCPVPSVVTIHDLSFFRLPETFPRRQGAYLRAATRHAARRASRLLAVSAFTAAELQTLLGVPAERIRVVPNGVDPSFRPLDPDARGAVRRALGLPERYVLAVGTLQPRKNLGTLLEAYAELRRRWPDAEGEAPHLVVAGAPGWGDQDLATRAAALGIADGLRLPGYVAPADLPGLYAAADCLAYPSRYEGFGLPALEAMACGTPVIAAEGSSLPEVVGGAGRLAPPEDPAAWAAALREVLSRPERRAEMRARGLERARGYGWSRCARETAALYGELLADGAAAPTLEARHGGL